MEKNNLENYLKQLEKIDAQLDGNDDDINPDELQLEINKVLSELSKDIETEVSKPTLKFINKSNNPDPSFAHEGDSGFDLRANINKEVIINVGQTKLIPTGLYFEVNKGMEIQIRSRSGLAAKNNTMVLNSPGTIDSQYRGEIQIILTNFGDMPITIRHGDRIAQGVVCPVYGEGLLDFEKVKELSETKRNVGGFGSTGKT